jgi:hypothetical protein
VTDIVAFLTARLDEDQAVAEAATPGPWRVDRPPYWTNVVVPEKGFEWVGVAGQRMDTRVFTGQTSNRGRAEWEADALHIARHDPARVLRDVAAARAIVAQYQAAAANADAETDTEEGWVADGVVDALAGVIRILAAAHADHPDYDPAWRVE